MKDHSGNDPSLPVGALKRRRGCRYGGMVFTMLCGQLHALFFISLMVSAKPEPSVFIFPRDTPKCTWHNHFDFRHGHIIEHCHGQGRKFHGHFFQNFHWHVGKLTGISKNSCHGHFCALISFFLIYSSHNKGDI